MTDKPDTDKCIECPYCVPETTCFNRLRVMDSQIEALRQERKALTREREALKVEREQLHALYVINLRVLNLVNAPAQTGEKENATDFTSRFTQ